MSKSKKRSAGFTLVELIVAVTVLAVAIAGTVTVFHVGFSTGTDAHDMTIASIEAQLQMESLMGRRWVGDLALGGFLDSSTEPPTAVSWNTSTTENVTPAFQSNGLWVRLHMVAYPVTTPTTHVTDTTRLAQVTVTVYRTPTDAGIGRFAIRHRNIINVLGDIL